jgi:hypothetical protein
MTSIKYGINQVCQTSINMTSTNMPTSIKAKSINVKSNQTGAAEQPQAPKARAVREDG